MAAPADGSTTTTTVGHQDDEAVVKSTMPLPRAIQLVMAIVWSRSKSPTTTTTSTKTIGDLFGVDRRCPVLWMKLVFVPSMIIIVAAAGIYTFLSDDDDDGGGGREIGVGYLAIPLLLYAYMAVTEAAGGHLGLFAPRAPYAAWEAFHMGACYEGVGCLVVLTSVGILLPGLMIVQAWPLLVAWACLLGVLLLSIIALWLCIFRTYGGDERRRENGGFAEAAIDGLAYLYSRLLYEYALRFHAVVADADAGAQQQQLDAPLLV